MREIWDLYNAKREIVDSNHRAGNMITKGLFHLDVSVWLINNAGNYLMSKRHPNKKYPCVWECTGGAVLAGETSLEGAVREVKEELGIELDATLGKKIHSECREVYQDFYDVWLFKCNVGIENVVLQKNEVIDCKWMSKEEIREIWGKKKMHPLLSYDKLVFNL